ncbi:TPA: hypothetical protein PPD39_003747 [Acinetobacter baumannii]|uniref:hypothetical protein n=3 Tax=Acinetobacter baumannii TaxID=470 RepID=UPI00124772C5|nr:hypothetical protein [Acinetobacter baumannii]KAB1097232.1 hypothetical protein F6W73_17355 [Acinetobacter baumannii]MCA4182836.1 hypothetical protein [Acinetobacter baumannii]MCA4385911.1 hypothetical protein [Acinetobacter baumannii]MCV4242969.1 hypothetical protein [Acinetobacter baumannii]MDA4972653.1 hypothetical protein [Acinetobacter baumannii]
MKNDINLYWVEGECEMTFIKSSPLLGKAEKVDLCELPLNKLKARTIRLSGNKKKLFLYIVFDTDVLKNDPAKLTNFLQNLTYLERSGFKLKLLQQDADFEDEIMKSNNMGLSKFRELFNVRNKSEFKSNMLREHSMHKKIVDKIPTFKLWESELISTLSIHIGKQSSYHKQPTI